MIAVRAFMSTSAEGFVHYCPTIRAIKRGVARRYGYDWHPEHLTKIPDGATKRARVQTK
jgi:hypothetical protein